jgi:hypothetical protein
MILRRCNRTAVEIFVLLVRNCATCRLRAVARSCRVNGERIGPLNLARATQLVPGIKCRFALLLISPDSVSRISPVSRPMQRMPRRVDECTFEAPLLTVIIALYL